jgi:hypothetical protein
MPIAYIDVPPGIHVDAKRRLVNEVFLALDEAYRVRDTRIFLREWPVENVSQLWPTRLTGKRRISGTWTALRRSPFVAGGASALCGQRGAA